MLLLAGLVFFNVATANTIVRLVLLAIGALRPSDVTDANAAAAAAASQTGRAAPPTTGQPADRLKGGRLLGPMERLVILGLGLAGEFGAAGLVIAAKGLLRFPEIQAAARNNTGDPTSASYQGGPGRHRRHHRVLPRRQLRQLAHRPRLARADRLTLPAPASLRFPCSASGPFPRPLPSRRHHVTPGGFQ